MTRLSERELAALESARLASISIDDEALMREARTLRAIVLADLTGRGLRRLRSLLGLDRLAERLRQRRLYRQTLRELSQLDARELEDIGIAPGELRAAARRAAGLDAPASGGLFARLRRSLEEARARGRAADELAVLDRRLLLDIGVEPGGIDAFLEQAQRRAAAAPAGSAGAPAVAFDLLMGETRRPAAAAWQGELPEAANQPAAQHLDRASERAAA